MKDNGHISTVIWEPNEVWARIGKGKFGPENYLNVGDILAFNSWEKNTFTVEKLEWFLNQ